ncbi:PREDICTED: uncharacterized protein LOC104611701 isoform X1 [Nelumbo nucifera]|uniref:Uncharacterized protein n=2 Tax=Nelumbo nucifera TaxID=4432 RepID=A0A822XM96_NELNU|nr:PREDICTED: uncharacterized protein LOC104611701 isoform X1 [Nelumbo nucifera]DAD21397.1 TPA_asm: hypothetical protein HUJ06_022860 [Nelumbo nucifera]
MASSCMRWRKMWLKRKSTMEELYWRVPEMEKCCLCMENSYGRHIETKIELNLISTRQSRHLPATDVDDTRSGADGLGSEARVQRLAFRFRHRRYHLDEFGGTSEAIFVTSCGFVGVQINILSSAQALHHIVHDLHNAGGNREEERG